MENRPLEQPRLASRALQLWFRLIPLFISAGLYLSGLFALIAPLPLLMTAFRYGIPWTAFACITNAVFVYYSAGPTSFQFYILCVVTASLAIPPALKRKVSLEKTTALTWVLQMGALAATIGVYAHLHGLGFLEEVRRILDGFFEFVLQSLGPEAKQNLLGDLDESEWRTRTIAELPSIIATSALVFTWVNLTFLVNLNPGRLLSRMGYDRRSFYRWKTWEHFVWFAILSWAVVLYKENGVWSDTAMNLFKFLMAIYAIQGLAVLGFAFERWKVRGFLRALGYFMATFVMIPLLLSIGFFDQWFDFRAKLRQK